MSFSSHFCFSFFVGFGKRNKNVCLHFLKVLPVTETILKKITQPTFTFIFSCRLKMKIHHRGLLQRVASPILKTLGIIAALYLFVCSLTFLSTAFRILGGRNLSNLFQNSDILSNPIVGIMIGILVTVAVQSSATSTSIIVALVSAGAPVKNTIPMIFGSNVGTSVTNTIGKNNKRIIHDRKF